MHSIERTVSVPLTMSLTCDRSAVRSIVYSGGRRESMAVDSGAARGSGVAAQVIV